MIVFDTFIATCHRRLSTFLEQYLLKNKSPAVKLHQAILYALENHGKQIRPLLVYATGRSLGASWESLDIAASAVEMIHTYSLVHDDLPAMDNADLRRSKPTLHKVMTEAIAILAGDALQPMAFELLAAHPEPSLSPVQRLAMITLLAKAAGPLGMAGGQTLDILPDTATDILQLYQLKTGALLSASIELGMLAAHPHPNNTLLQFASTIGLAFQLQDDLLDIQSDSVTLGKDSQIDSKNHKKTYPFLHGIEKTQQLIELLFQEAHGHLNIIGEKAYLLREMTDYLHARKK